MAQKAKSLYEIVISNGDVSIINYNYIMLFGENAKLQIDENNFEVAAKQYSAAILANTETVLRQLDDYELALLTTISRCNRPIPLSSCILFPAVISFFLADFTGYPQKDNVEIYITEDFSTAIQPYLDKLLKDKETEIFSSVESVILGILNIYGVVKRSQIVKILSEIFPDIHNISEADDLMDDIFSNSAAIKCLVDLDDNVTKNDFYLMSRYVDDPSIILKGRKTHKEIKGLNTDFTLEEFHDAGQPFLPVLPNPYHKELRNLLIKKCKMDDNEAEMNIFNIFCKKQVGDYSMDSIHIFEGYCNSIDDLNDCIKVLMNYENAAPVWTFSGYSSSQIRTMLPCGTTPPKLIAGPNMRADGMNITPEMQKMFEEAWRKNRGN